MVTDAYEEIEHDLMNLKSYVLKLREHYERYYGVRGKVLRWHIGPTEKLHPEFFILELPPGRHAVWTYATVGMSADRSDDNLIELIVYSARKDRALLELLTLAASYHRNAAPLGLHHTVNVGKGVSYIAACNHGLISLP